MPLARFGQGSPRPAPRATGTLLSAARMGATFGAGHSHYGWLPRAARTGMSVGLPAPSLWPVLSCPAPRAPGALLPLPAWRGRR
eukprot:14225842-Alexandrium_andersonii.AAC.1